MVIMALRARSIPAARSSGERGHSIHHCPLRPAGPRDGVHSLSGHFLLAPRALAFVGVARVCGVDGIQWGRTDLTFGSPRCGVAGGEGGGGTNQRCSKELPDSQTPSRDPASKTPARGGGGGGRRGQRLPVTPGARPLHFAPRIPESDQLLRAPPEIHLQKPRQRWPPAALHPCLHV